MRRFFVIVAPILFLCFASSAFADGIDYTATSSLSGSSFTFTFSLPSTLTSLDTAATVNFTEGSLNLTNLPATVVFFSAADKGLFNILVTIEGTDTFEFFGSQIYSGTGSGPFTLLPGTFPLSASLGYGDVMVNGHTVADLVGGTVTATTATPEPTTLALLGSGLFAIGALRRKKRLP
jgi:hypothetical protein